jgi:hypothetical protein
MQSYATFTGNIAQEEHDDPVTYEEFKQTDDSHPREVMTIRRSNGVPFPYHTQTVIELINRNMPDPFTRQRFSELTKKRAKLYASSLEAFPDRKVGDMDTDLLFRKWIASRSDGDLSNEEKKLIDLEAECFLQAEDLTSLFKEYDGSGSMNNRTRAVSDVGVSEYSEMNKIAWVLRKCSVSDTQYDKAYAITCMEGNTHKHHLIIHRIGEGFFYNPTGISRGDPANQLMVGYESCHPTIIDILRKFL